MANGPYVVFPTLHNASCLGESVVSRCAQHGSLLKHYGCGGRMTSATRSDALPPSAKRSSKPQQAMLPLASVVVPIILVVARKTTKHGTGSMTGRLKHCWKEALH